MSKLMDRLHRKVAVPQPRQQTKQLMRGGMGEPYCSQECYSTGGAAITEEMMRGVTGVPCHVCGQPLDFRVGTRTSMVYIAGAPAYFHQTEQCDGAVRAEVADLTTCVVCGSSIGELTRRSDALADVYGKDLAARLIGELGLSRALELGESALASARERWTHRFEPDFLTAEEKEERGRASAKSGTVTIETRAAFLTSWDAELVAGDAARAALAAAGLPADDRDLFLDFGAGIYRHLS